MAISDEKRREVAARLRGLDEATSTLSPEYSRQEYDAMVLRAIRAVVGEGDIFHLLADLIDRPTCRNVSGSDDVFKCSECGAEFEPIAVNGNEYGDVFYTPLKPLYCSACGAEVVE